MGIKTIRFDDLDGSTEETTPLETVPFTVEGTDYEIDLHADNAAKFRGVLGPYISAGRKATAKRTATAASTSGRSGASGGAKPDREQNKAIRDWARAHGYGINDRGRIPVAVQDAYHLGGDAAVAALQQCPGWGPVAETPAPVGEPVAVGG